jgi:DNA ligase (NAD+)
MFAFAIEPIEGRITASTHSEILNLLTSWGFPVEEHRRRFGSLEQVQEQIESYEALIASLPFQADGVVVKVDSLALHTELGVTSRHDRRPRRSCGMR